MNIRSFPKFHNEWFLWLCPAFLVIRGFVRFSASVEWQDALVLFFEYSAWSLAIACLLCIFLPFRKAAILATALVLFNAVYSIIYEYAIKHENSIFVTRFGFVASLVAILFFLLFYWLRRTKRKFNQATKFLNLLFFVLIITEIVQFSFDLLQRQKNVVHTLPCNQCPKPDVYLIITDGYAGKKQLAEQFGLDNTPFEDSLRQLGFYVIDSSISNYANTNLSMASMLRMNYVVAEKDADIHAPFNPTSVTSFFKRQGYKVINNSIFNLDGEFPKQTTSFFKTGTELLTQHSFVSHASFVIHNLLAEAGYSGEIKRLNHLKETAAKKERRFDSTTMESLVEVLRSSPQPPKFVYTHFLMPHAPYLFDEDGKPLKDTGSYTSQYKSFLKYTNKQLLFAVRSILQMSAKPPVILLLSDHGSRIDNWTKFGRLQFYNLAAVYVPGKSYSMYYKGISNVNQFRVLLNHQFNQKLDLLPDSTVDLSSIIPD